jgi:spore maturation protein CgeB
MMSALLAKNLAVLAGKNPEAAARVQAAGQGPAGYSVAQAANGQPTLTVRDPEGRTVSIHSRRDPGREAAGLAQKLSEQVKNPIVLLGIGLGYPLTAVAEKIPADAPLVVIEPDAGLFRLALEHLDLTDVLARPDTHWLIGAQDAVVKDVVTRLQIRANLAPITLLVWRPLVRALTKNYAGLAESLEAMSRGTLKKRLDYPRLDRPQCRVLILNSKYYLLPEIQHALDALGHEHRLILIRDKEVSSDELIRDLLRLTAEFQPDFLLTINHLGFDREGILTRFLETIELPFASWYVDSPTLILSHYHHNLTDLGAIFLWDSDYLADVRRIGFDRVFYLPLATDPAQFAPTNGRPNPLAPLACDVSFVGNSMVGPVTKKIEQLGMPADFRPHLDRLAEAFINSPDRSAEAVFDDQAAADPWFQSLDEAGRIDLAALITWRATQEYRLRRVERLAEFGPTLIGDLEWRDLLPSEKFKTPGPLNYYQQLPLFYPLSRINFNATSLQMKTGLNQRVFDVPACRAFLLTDHRTQIEALYKVGREVITYDHPDEIPDLVKHYLAHPDQARAVAEAAYQRTLAEHTYVHRLDRLINTMRREFAS